MTDLMSSEWRARAEAFVPIVMAAHPDIVSVDSLWATTRDTPMYVPREFFREAAQATVGESASLPLINDLRTDELIPRRWHRESHQALRGNYRYVVETTGFDLDVGAVVTRRGAFDTDHQLTLDEIFYWADTFGPDSGPLNMAPGFAMSIVHAFHQAGASW